jgi:quinol monooxygenase YgiN
VVATKRLPLPSPAMPKVARYARTVAREGKGGEVAQRLLAAAAHLESDDPGCELYLVNREAGSPDVIWVTEVWRSQADLDACLARIQGSKEVAAVAALVETWEVTELEPLGGKGA